MPCTSYQLWRPLKTWENRSCKAENLRKMHHWLLVSVFISTCIISADNTPIIIILKYLDYYPQSTLHSSDIYQYIYTIYSLLYLINRLSMLEERIYKTDLDNKENSFPLSKVQSIKTTHNILRHLPGHLSDIVTP